MKLIGIIADHPTPKATLDEVMFTTGASDCHRGGGYCIAMVKENDISESDRSSDGEQPSGRILRTRRI